MSYIGNEPIVSATRTVTEITATAGQTTFTANGGYTVGYIDVFVNGAQLQSADFTATNGSTVVLTQAAQVGDNVRLVAWGTFSSANITSGSLSAGGITWSPTGGVTLPRIDSSNEGGQLNFNRASDNTATWSIDSFGNTSTPSLRFIDGANVRAVIDSSGNVGIGTSSPSHRLHVAGSGSTYVFVSSSNAGSGTGFWTENSTNAYVIGAGAASGGSGLEFRDVTNSATRMTLDSGGNLRIGTTGAIWSTEKASIQAGSTGGYALTLSTETAGGFAPLLLRNNDANSTKVQIYFAHSGTVPGSVTTTASATQYNTSSDYRLKENVAPMTGALAKVSQLKPVTYTWKVDGSAGEGFIAHELAEVVPQCVTGEKDEVDAEGNPRYQGVDVSFLVATLTAAIQELKSIVDNQKIELDNAKAEIELLKGAN